MVLSLYLTPKIIDTFANLLFIEHVVKDNQTKLLIEFFDCLEVEVLDIEGNCVTLRVLGELRRPVYLGLGLHQVFLDYQRV